MHSGLRELQCNKSTTTVKRLAARVFCALNVSVTAACACLCQKISLCRRIYSKKTRRVTADAESDLSNECRIDAIFVLQAVRQGHVAFNALRLYRERET